MTESVTDIRFYHLQNQPLDAVLPVILEKALERGHRVIVKGQDEKTVTSLNDHLWTYRPDKFLPHGTAKDGHAELQPVYLTTKPENPNKADVLMLCDAPEDIQDLPIETYTLCCDLFNGNNDEALKSARARWKKYKEDGYNVTYWQQDDRGRWIDKTAA